MSGEENPYASPRPLNDDAVLSVKPRFFLASFLGMQAGGMIGLVSSIASPLRYFIHFNSARYLGSPRAVIYIPIEQILGECFFILLSTLILGLVCGMTCEIGHWLASQRFLAGDWLLFSSGRIRRLSLRGLFFAIVCTAPAFVLASKETTISLDGDFLAHWIWALTHFAAALYFGERFAEACRRAQRTA